MEEQMKKRKIKFPALSSLRSRSKKVSPLDKFYAHVFKAVPKLKKPLDVTKISVSQEDSEQLEKLMLSWAKIAMPLASDKSIEYQVGIEMLMYSPSTNDKLDSGYIQIDL